MSKSPFPPTRVNLDPNPPKYTTPVPTFPRDPRLPSDIPSFLSRDTQRATAADPESGAHEVTTDAELTPVESLYGLRKIAAELKELTLAVKAGTQASQHAANESIATRAELRGVADEVKSLTRRVTALELSSKWAPLTLSAVSLALVLWLGFQAQQTQVQVQALQAQIQLLKPAK